MISFLKKIFFILSIISLKSKIKKSKKIYVYDIDNTLSNSWPYINNKKIFPEKLPFFEKIRDDILKNINSGNLIFFASVRPFKYYFITLSWLKKLGIYISKKQLLFFSNPKQKIEFLKTLLKINKSIKFYDDLSYNHENNKILFYKEDIKKLNQLNIEYIDYYMLKKNQNKIKKIL
tara:strand:- start:213 stop:740 length:528 start_codon:yes stop_codon:yes gene_type:complete